MSEKRRAKDTPENTGVDPEEFARQVNYLAALGRLVVPRAFGFGDRAILFVGHEPFDAEDLGNLLPDGSEWYELAYASEQFSPDVVVLGAEGFPEEAARSVLGRVAGSAKILPQEGFLNELLFGHDWWTEGSDSLRQSASSHRGIQLARDAGALTAIGLGPPQPIERKTPIEQDDPAPAGRPRTVDAPVNPAKPVAEFAWPGTDAEETSGDDVGEFDLRARSKLNELGYNTNLSRSARWRVLTSRAVPELGLPKVASMIAWFCRSRKQQKGGRQKFTRAIGEWEYDLARLKRELYPGYRPGFAWPRHEP